MNKTTQIEILKFILSQTRRAERRKAMLDNQLDILRDKMSHPIDGIQYKLDLINGGFTTDGAGALPLKMEEIEDKIIEQMETITLAVNRTLDILSLLPANSDERIILSAYYVNGDGYEQIAEDFHMGLATVWRKMRIGLETLAQDERIQTMISDAEEEWRHSL